MKSVLLSAENIKKSYGKKNILKGVSILLKEGEIHSLLGPNGAGKTTLIKVLSTLLTIDSGSIQIIGKDSIENREVARHLIGYVGQDTERSAYARLTVKENLHFFGRLRGLSSKKINERIVLLSNYFDFHKYLDSLFVHLSGGQKQTVVIMRGLLHDPPIIFLDEPTKGLDPVIARKIRRFLRSYVTDKRKALLLTSHIMNEVDELSDTVSFIRDGVISVSDEPSAIKAALGTEEYLDFEAGSLSAEFAARISNLPSVLKVVPQKKGGISFAITDFIKTMEEVLPLLREKEFPVSFSHHKTSLEDAFIHFSGSEINKDAIEFQE